jgi:hypothetical protein
VIAVSEIRELVHHKGRAEGTHAAVRRTGLQQGSGGVTP